MKKKSIIIATVTCTALLVSAAIAKADVLTELVDSQLVGNLIPAPLKQIAQSISAGKAVGVDTIARVFKPSDDTENIDEDAWKEIDEIGLEISDDKAIANSGVGAGYFNGQLTQSALKNIDKVNNKKVRTIEKVVIEERPKIQQILKENSKDAESTLGAENQRNKMLAANASIDLRRLDMESRALTANQIRNANDLKKRQDDLAEKRNQEIANKAQLLRNADLTYAIINPYYGEK